MFFLTNENTIFRIYWFCDFSGYIVLGTLWHSLAVLLAYLFMIFSLGVLLIYLLVRAESEGIMEFDGIREVVKLKSK